MEDGQSACRRHLGDGIEQRVVRSSARQQLDADRAARHPRVAFILAHIGGGGDYMHTFPAIADCPNIYPDLSGSGVDRGMLDSAVDALGASRLLWGCDLTMETGLAKLRALTVLGLTDDELSAVRWRNAARIFPRGSFPRCINSPNTSSRQPATSNFG